MPVAKKAAAKAAPVASKRSTQSRSSAAQASASTSSGTSDPSYLRLQALSFARSLYGDAQSTDGDTPIVSAAKLATQAKRIEKYLTGGDANDASDD